MNSISTMQPFTKGDIFVGATLLNSKEDDHAGVGRIIQFDQDLNEKGVLWVEGTTHLIAGLTFAPDEVLWGFDTHSRTIVHVAPTGQQLPLNNFDDRSFCKVHFLSDDRICLCEFLVGANQPENLTTRFKPLPGQEAKQGDGDIYIYDAEGNLLQVFDPETHGGIPGNHGVTHSVLSGDGNTLFYVSETGPRLMRFDLATGTQLPDLRTFPFDREHMYFGLTRAQAGELLCTRGNGIEVMDEEGRDLDFYPLEGFGWALVEDLSDGRHCVVGNWFSGEVIKFNKQAREIVASENVGERCIAGIAQYSG